VFYYRLIKIIPKRKGQK